nr:response regulator [Ignavibacterium sp.]
EEFRQIDGTTTKKYNGTGLGLAISKKILDLIGGNIWVESVEGKGSVFSFTIPIKYQQDRIKQAASSINPELLRKNARNPVLIIDDDQEVRYTIGQYLISNGYETIFAEDGETAIKLAIEKQPFAITLDLLLPNRDGWSILKELKENPKTKGIPVILVSIIGDKNLGFGLGAFEYFVKPISAEKLISAFKKLESIANKQIQKIVIVDDDEFEFEKFKKEFKDEKLSIEYIRDSEFAFNKIAEVQPDLIILDLLMPKIDGITLTNKLKSNSKTQNIPIIISTAKHLADEEQQFLANIAEDIIIKSSGDSSDVLKAVRDRLRLHEIDSLTPKDETEYGFNSSSVIEEEQTNNSA